MGLFSAIKDLFSIVPQTPKPRLGIDGNEQTQVYVYDGAPVRNIELGGEAYADVLPGDMLLTSRLTGTTTNTKEFEDSVLSIGGKAFGLVGSRLGPVLKQAASRGYEVKVLVRRTGTYAPGYPELVALTIRPIDIEYWWDTYGKNDAPQPVTPEEIMALRPERVRAIRKRVTGLDMPEGCEPVWIHLTRDSYLGSSFPKRHRTFSPRFKLLEPKAGSKAKPHIAICNSKTMLYELSARNREAYETVLSHMGSPCTGSLVRDYFECGADDDWRLVLVFGTPTNTDS